MLDRIQCRSVVQVFPGDDAGMGASWRKNGERPGFFMAVYPRHEQASDLARARGQLPCNEAAVKALETFVENAAASAFNTCTKHGRRSYARCVSSSIVCLASWRCCPCANWFCRWTTCSCSSPCTWHCKVCGRCCLWRRQKARVQVHEAVTQSDANGVVRANDPTAFVVASAMDGRANTSGCQLSNSRPHTAQPQVWALMRCMV